MSAGAPRNPAIVSLAPAARLGTAPVSLPAPGCKAGFGVVKSSNDIALAPGSAPPLPTSGTGGACWPVNSANDIPAMLLRSYRLERAAVPLTEPVRTAIDHARL